LAEAKYLPEFVEALKKHSNIRKSAKKKIESLLENPLNYGEPLKHELQGLSSFPVRKNFLIVYVYCRECRIKNYQEINCCKDCDNTPDEVVKFLTIAPHDLAYQIAKKMSL